MNPWLSVRKFFAKRRELDRLRRSSIKEVFTGIYLTNRWGDTESVSGKGSSLRRTAGLAAALPGILQTLGVRSMLDIPCGDFHWMKEVQLSGISYLGADIVEPLIDANRQRYGNADRQFTVLDLTRDPLPRVDAVFCRECLVHFSFDHIKLAVATIRSSGSTWLLATQFPEITRNQDIVTGKHRPLNFTLPPFNWPAPMQTYEEYHAGRKRGVKCLAVWRIDDLPG